MTRRDPASPLCGTLPFLMPYRDLAGNPTARLIAGAVTISFAPVFVRLVDVPPTVSAFYRTLIGGLVLLVIVRMRRHSLSGGRTVFIALLAAGAAFAADLAVWHRSILYIGPGLATLLGNFQVFFLALAGILWFGERMRLATSPSQSRWRSPASV